MRAPCACAIPKSCRNSERILCTPTKVLHLVNIHQLPCAASAAGRRGVGEEPYARRSTVYSREIHCEKEAFILQFRCTNHAIFHLNANIILNPQSRCYRDYNSVQLVPTIFLTLIRFIMAHALHSNCRMFM